MKDIAALLGHKATRELIWGTACLGVALGLWATGHTVPEMLGGLVFALVVNSTTHAVKS